MEVKEEAANRVRMRSRSLNACYSSWCAFIEIVVCGVGEGEGVLVAVVISDVLAVLLVECVLSSPIGRAC